MVPNPTSGDSTPPRSVLSVEFDLPSSPVQAVEVGRGCEPCNPAEALLLRIVRRVRAFEDAGRRCPRCSSNHVIKWGRFSGRQRYRCKGCERTFSDLTGTPMAYSKRLDLWMDFGRCMVEGLSVRAAGRRLGITKDTAFRWRHLLANRYRLQAGPPISGLAVLGSTYLPVSEKGRRPRDRPSRRKRGWLRGPCSSGISHVIFAQEEGAPDWHFALFRGKRMQPRSDDLVRQLGPVIGAGGDLVSDRPPYSSLAAFAREGGHRLLDGRGRRWCSDGRPSRRPIVVDGGGVERERAMRAVDRIRKLVRNWRLWLGGFRGVATRYLRNYLAWHRHVARATGPCIWSQIANVPGWCSAPEGHRRRNSFSGSPSRDPARSHPAGGPLRDRRFASDRAQPHAGSVAHTGSEPEGNRVAPSLLMIVPALA